MGAAAVDRGVHAQIAADLDAGICTRDIEEARTVKRAYPDIFNCLGLDRKVGRLSPAQGNQAYCRAENECPRRHHKNFPVPRFEKYLVVTNIANSQGKNDN